METLSNEEADNIRKKVNDFFNNEPKRDTIKDRLKELKEQLELPVQESEAVILSETTEIVTNQDKTLSIYNDLTGDQLDFINLMIPMEFNITNICAELGMSRTTYYRWLEENEAFKTAYDNTREYLVDKAEQVLLKSMNEMDAKTAQFVLKALTKRYKDKIDITSNGQTMGSVINVIQPNINLNDGNA